MYQTGDHLATMGFEVDYLFAGQFHWRVPNGLKRFTVPWEAALLLRRIQRARGSYDLIELHEPLTFGHGLLRCIRRSQGKLVAFSYGLEDRSRKIMLDYRRDHGIATPIKGLVTSKVHTLQSVIGLRLCDHVVCSNQSDVDYLQARGFAPERLTRHFSGIEEDLLVAGAAAVGTRRPDILFVGNWLDRKGIYDLIPAMTNVLRQHTHVRFTVAGCQLQKNQICDGFPADLHDRIQVVPWLANDDELAALYSNHGIFVLPSYFEGQPLVMIEAAAFGLAIVTTPTCGMLDFIRDGENGLFAPVGDAAALENAISRLVKKPDEAICLGMRAREDAIGHTWRKSAENLCQSYRRILSA